MKKLYFTPCIHVLIPQHPGDFCQPNLGAGSVDSDEALTNTDYGWDEDDDWKE